MEVDGDAMLKTCLLLDCMQLELVDMDLFSAVRVPVSGQQNTSAFTYKRQGIKLLNEKCKLSLCVERNLDWAFSRKGKNFVPELSIGWCTSIKMREANISPRICMAVFKFISLLFVRRKFE